VLYEPGGLADLERAYDRYLAFEEFRRELAKLDGVTALEVGPADRLSAVLEAGDRDREGARMSARIDSVPAATGGTGRPSSPSARSSSPSVSSPARSACSQGSRPRSSDTYSDRRTRWRPATSRSWQSFRRGAR